MKIILSPSKSQDIRRASDIDNQVLQTFVNQNHLFDSETASQLKRQKKITSQLVSEIREYDDLIIAKKMKLKGKLLEKVLQDYSEFSKKESTEGLAALSYTGTVFKELKLESYDQESLDYMHKHLVILSALYGPIPALYPIKSYRLDMNMSLFRRSLYQIWKPVMGDVFQNNEVIVDLASKEFSKQVSGNTVTVEFQVWQNEQYKSIPFHSKQGRGLLAHYMIEKCITDLEELKNFCSLGYRYDSELSFPNHFVYKKDKSH